MRSAARRRETFIFRETDAAQALIQCLVLQHPAARSPEEKLGAAPLDFFLRSKEFFNEVEGSRGPFSLEPDAVLPRDVGETSGDIRPASENNAFDLLADRCQRRTDIVAAIEEGGASGIGNGLARRCDERPEP